MSTSATGQFDTISWDEHPFGEANGGSKLARATVTNVFRGDIEGRGTLEYLMVYHDDESATFIGLEQVVGRLADREGSFVLQHSGTYRDSVATGTWTVVPGSGTGDLSDLTGQGSFDARHGQPATYTLRFTLD